MLNNLLKYLKYVLVFAALAVLLGCLYCCSPQKRLNRLIDNHPELLIKDTVRTIDTVITKETHADTVVQLARLTDTIFLNKERLQVKVYRVHDSIFIQGKVRSDTILKTISIPVDKIVYRDIPWRLAWYWVVIAFVCGIAIIFFIYIKQKGPA